MPAEQMGQISRRLRLAFAVTSVVFLVALAISPVKDLLREWKRYKRAYVRFAQTRPDTKRLLADYHPEIDQIWIPEMGVVDRCTTCHQGIAEPSLLDPSVPQPFRAHPPIPHPRRDWGCTACHRGQGAATEVTEAHETTLAWEQPLLPVHFIQASCGTCHRADLPETPQLDRGRQLWSQLNCVGLPPVAGCGTPGHARARSDQHRHESQPPMDLQVVEGTAHRHRQQRQRHRERLRLRGFAAAHAAVPPDRTGTAWPLRLI